MAAMSIWLNRLAPDFALANMDGSRFMLSAWRGHIIVINFWSSECTWSRRADVLLAYRMLTWEGKGVRTVGVACCPEEAEGAMRYEIQNRRINYPVVVDREQRVASLYRAEVTPQFFVLDRDGIVRYTGALDNATEQSRDGRTQFLDQAVSALLANQAPNPSETRAFGCRIAGLPAPDRPA
jgi:peroxiredoxin